jgi:hypothetical protein
VEQLFLAYVPLRELQEAREYDSPAWHLYGEARAALLRLISYLDTEEG